MKMNSESVEMIICSQRQGYGVLSCSMVRPTAVELLVDRRIYLARLEEWSKRSDNNVKYKKNGINLRIRFS